MQAHIEMEGVHKVIAALEQLSLKGKKKATVRVSYETPYAVYVHEDMNKFHPIGQAKFLEVAYVRFRDEMVAIVGRSVKAKNGLLEGLQRAGELLKRESLSLCPIDTGALRASARVIVEKTA